MTSLFLSLFLLPAALAVYSYIVYPLVLRALPVWRHRRLVREDPSEWPYVSISVPVHNEAAQIDELIESLLALDYPADRRQILIISDASDDGTDEIVSSYAHRGLELLRMPQRSGKTAAENAGAVLLRGQIVVNTDASIRILPESLKPLIRQFSNPVVGVASGRDISVSPGNDANVAEGGYVDYEMRIRALETRTGGIVGSSGCFYGIRAELHRVPLPNHLSRDFASALIAREHGMVAASVDDAVCLVPRTTSLTQEFTRKVRTMSRGMETLMYKRQLLNPAVYGLFAWKLLSHKVGRWLVPPAALLGIVGLTGLAFVSPWARVLALLFFLMAAAAATGWYASRTQHTMPRLLALLASAVAANVAVLYAIPRAWKGDEGAAWEPTRRERPVETAGHQPSRAP